MDLYMAGSTFNELNNMMQENGYNKLLSQLNDRPTIEQWTEFKRKHPDSKSKLFIDSGAFTAHTKGAEVDVDEYIEYLNAHDDAFTVFAQVDKIPGTFGKPYTREELLEAPAKSWENYLYMKDKLKSRDKLIPIFHQGEDFKWLKNMLEYTHEDGKHIAYIGISTRNDASPRDKKDWLSEVFNIIKRSSNPDVKTHAFGMTSQKLLQLYPFTSADSTSWIQTSVNGSIFTKYGLVLVGDKSKHKKDHIENIGKDEHDEIVKYIESKGFKLQDLIDDYKQRELFNIMYLNDWIDNDYKFKGGNLLLNSLF